MKRVALVTGGNRGIGFEICRQLANKGLQVVLTARDPSKGEKAVARLKSEGLDVRFAPLDVTDSASIQNIARFMEKEFGRCDVLVNNAGILVDKDSKDPSALKTDIKKVEESLRTNLYGPFQLCQQFIPLMKKNGYGRIVNMSSGMGQLSEMNGGYPAYRISKTALNAVTRIFADETDGTGILVNSMCPGWVKTDMGGAGAERSTEEGADTASWLATLSEGGPTGGFFRDREPIAW
jgi:NAD(P)-dependent dehydrogenase (short-subunit alcohol dehydrogenase family)